jgi:hypothetical protein
VDWYIYIRGVKSGEGWAEEYECWDGRAWEGRDASGCITDGNGMGMAGVRSTTIIRYDLRCLWVLGGNDTIVEFLCIYSPFDDDFWKEFCLVPTL